MPWTKEDVDRHKKGLSDSQKHKWVTIANAALESCKKRGGEDCDAYAIRTANSRTSTASETIFNLKKVGHDLRDLEDMLAQNRSRKIDSCITCKKPVDINTEFRDELSKKEWGISHMCQDCQDSIFEGEGE